MLTCAACSTDLWIFPFTTDTSCPDCKKDVLMQNKIEAPHSTVGHGAAPRGPSPTADLPRLHFDLPVGIEGILSGGSSVAGLSAVKSYLSCPEYARLRNLGVRRRRRPAEEGEIVAVDLSGDPLGYGSLIHALRATRIVYGMAAALSYLGGLEIDETSRSAARNMLLMYDFNFPIEQDPFEYLGVEVEVWTDISDSPAPCLRSVRYDAVVRSKQDGAIFSFECKTTARSGDNQLSQYMPQKFSHSALWNRNSALVAKYGPMRGTIYDLLVKTQVPKCARIGPQYVSQLQELRAIEYLRLPDKVSFPVAPDGAAMRSLHTCWGRYRPCEYIDLCFEGMYNAFEKMSTLP